MNSASPHVIDERASAATRKSSTLRRCLVTGEIKEKALLIRFALDLEGRVTPDLAERLPGRGLWVSADNASLQQAVSKNMFSRSAKTKAIIPDQLLENIPIIFKRRCLELLGLARSAGATVTGMPQIEHGLRTGKISIVLMASDAGRDSRKKLSRVPFAETGLTREELGQALGQEHLASIGMRSYTITQKLLTELVRWHGASAPSIV